MNTQSNGDREVAARIIDPEAFRMVASIGDRTDVVGTEQFRERCAEALVKADAVFALLPAKSPEDRIREAGHDLARAINAAPNSASQAEGLSRRAT